MTRAVAPRISERIRSHFGAANIDRIPVEIMGGIQKRTEGGAWEEPPDLARLSRTVLVGEMPVPVLSLEYEFQSYQKLGQQDKAGIIRERLERVT